MKKNSNSQKRIYNEYSTYFVTFKTLNNFPYFKNNVLCELFVLELELAKDLKNFMLFNFVILHDHVHLLLRPSNDFNISNCIHFIKRHFSRNSNILLNYTNPSRSEGEDGHPRLQATDKIDDYVLNNKIKKHNLPKFQWQKSYHDHIIRTQKDFENHQKYISSNYLKHNLPANWNYVGYNYFKLLDLI